MVLCTSWILVTVCFQMLGKFSAVIASKFFSGSFPPYSLSGILILQILVYLTLFQRSLKLSSFLFILFPLFYFAAVISTILTSSSLNIHASTSFILLLIPFSVFFISVIVFFNSGYLLELQTLLKTYGIFSLCASIFFFSSWITFTIFTLNFQINWLSLFHLVVFLGFYLSPLYGKYSFAVSFCLKFYFWSSRRGAVVNESD